MNALTQPVMPPDIALDDEVLVRRCLEGRQDAWNALIDKYRNLIFSIPIKYGISRDEAADIFQDVCVRLLSHLHDIREHRALAAWLIQVTVRECLQWRRQQPKRYAAMEVYPNLLSTAPAFDQVETETLREQTLREVIGGMAERCRNVIQMLFFTSPPLAYEQVAKQLGVATGSIGFIRMQCLQRLRRSLKQKGFA